MCDALLRVYLWSLTGPVIIVPGGTGIVYCNQTDGVCTVHRELEGWLLPLPKIEAEVFTPSWWEKHFNRRTAGDAHEWNDVCRKIESALAGLGSSDDEAPMQILVRNHPDNCEAWVQVSFLFADLGSDASDCSYVPMEGVLTWENCD